MKILLDFSRGVNVILILFQLNSSLALSTKKGTGLPGSVNRIIGGTLASPAQFPYQVAMYVSNTGRFCSGTIISNIYILTAAHCFSNLDDGQGHIGNNSDWTTLIQAGVTNLNDPGTNRTITNSNIIRHDQFNSTTLENSLALIKLTTPLAYSSTIQPVRLPSFSQAGAAASDSLYFVGRTMRLSGWGQVSDQVTGITNQLRYVDVTTMSNNDCIDYFWNVYNTTICTDGTNVKGGCVGDGGGPLTFVETDGQRTQLGVAIFANTDDCEGTSPTGYTMVTSFLQWIRDKTGVFIRP